ncbi:MAG: allantoicase [Gemmatimonadetes bacterium]|nr:allantoicase [Gemmatimonadota bacterium]
MTDFTELVDLAAEALGGTVIAANDEFFAPKEALLKPTPAEWREGAYTERGKWMDGWETRRRRTPGYDWAIVHLGAPGIVRGAVIDTSFFRGNYPERASIEGCEVEGTPSPDELTSDKTLWRTLLPASPLQGDSQNNFEIADGERVTHLRLNVFPDGGVARLRVYGDVKVTSLRHADATFDLAAIENGGYSVVCSDMFFGHRQNLIMPGRSTHMGNGWETKRRRGPGHDWTIIRLAQTGVVESVELDTDHYKGNAPDACMLECCFAPDASTESLTDSATDWVQIVPKSKLQPHARHQFAPSASPPATHVRLNIYPDGGVARLRLLGRRASVIAK